MKNHNSASKENRQIQRAAQHDASVGENATAIAPPAYGIEFVDRGLATGAHLTIQRKLTISTPGELFRARGRQSGGRGVAYARGHAGLRD